LIDAKGRDFDCFGLAKGEIAACKKKTREQAPAVHTWFSTASIIPTGNERSRKTFVLVLEGALIQGWARGAAEQRSVDVRDGVGTFIAAPGEEQENLGEAACTQCKTS
jgi:hypothetical protein